MSFHDSSSSMSPPNRTALRSRTGNTTTAAVADCCLSFPKNRFSKLLLLLGTGVLSGPTTLDATVDALAVSGVTLELAEGFLSAERAGGGGRREERRECECE